MFRTDDRDARTLPVWSLPKRGHLGASRSEKKGYNLPFLSPLYPSSLRNPRRSYSGSIRTAVDRGADASAAATALPGRRLLGSATAYGEIEVGLAAGKLAVSSGSCQGVFSASTLRANVLAAQGRPSTISSISRSLTPRRRRSDPATIILTASSGPTRRQPLGTPAPAAGEFYFGQAEPASFVATRKWQASATSRRASAVHEWRQ